MRGRGRKKRKRECVIVNTGSNGSRGESLNMWDHARRYVEWRGSVVYKCYSKYLLMQYGWLIFYTQNAFHLVFFHVSTVFVLKTFLVCFRFPMFFAKKIFSLSFFFFFGKRVHLSLGFIENKVVWTLLWGCYRESLRLGWRMFNQYMSE